MKKEEIEQLKEFCKYYKECEGCELPFKDCFPELYLLLKKLIKKYDKK
jgi:hypothetical protein